MGGRHTAVSEQEGGDAELPHLEYAGKYLEDLGGEPCGACADQGKIIQ
jgi:hypothetical protein